MAIYGDSGNNTLAGTSSNDQIFGYGGSDAIIGNEGDDQLYGGDGSDIYQFGPFFGRDFIEDNIGVDEIRFSSDISPSDVRLQGYRGDLYVLVDRFTSSIELNNHLNTVNGIDRIVFANGTSLSLTRGLTMTGSSNGDEISGTAFDDRISGLNGGDDIYGAGGNDRLDGGPSADGLYGGLGNDTYVFADNWGDGYYNDYIADVEGNNVIQFTSLPREAAHIRVGYSGNAIISFDGTGFELEIADYYDGNNASHFTFLFRGEGSGTPPPPGPGPGPLPPTPGNDTITGTSGPDTINGLGGDDIIDPLGGNDTVRGGDGNDTVGGGDGNDYVYGDAGNDRVNGAQGDDFVYGGTGNDNVRAGLGKDFLYGNEGRDTFDFDGVADSAVGSTRDGVMDFVRGQDKIDLTTIDANVGVSGNQAFTFIGTAAFSAAGQIRARETTQGVVVEGSVDGDSAAEFEIGLVGPHSLTTSDFLL